MPSDPTSGEPIAPPIIAQPISAEKRGYRVKSWQDFWTGFGDYTDITNVTVKTVTEGDKYTSFEGNSFSGQVGNAKGYVIGNTDSFRTGYSNTVLMGMSFSTSIAGTFSTTVGMSVSTTVGLAIAGHVGAKLAAFAGIEASINASQAIKVVKGDNYTWDTSSKNECGQQKIESDAKKIVIANDLKKVINDEIAVYAQGVSVVAGGDIASVCKSHSTTCVGDITLDSADTINITGMKNVSIAGGTSLTLESVSQVIISAPAKVTMGGALINIG